MLFARSSSPISPCITLSSTSSASPTPLSHHADTRSPWSPSVSLPKHTFPRLPQNTSQHGAYAKMDMRRYTNEFTVLAGAPGQATLPRRKRKSVNNTVLALIPPAQPTPSDKVHFLSAISEPPAINDSVTLFTPAAALSPTCPFLATSPNTPDHLHSLGNCIQPPSSSPPPSASESPHIADEHTSPEVLLHLPTSTTVLEVLVQANHGFHPSISSTRATLPRRRTRHLILLESADIDISAQVIAALNSILCTDGPSPSPSLSRPTGLVGSRRNLPIALTINTSVLSDVEVLAKRRGWAGIGAERKGTTLPRRKGVCV
jgi:hypothetical protein